MKSHCPASPSIGSGPTRRSRSAGGSGSELSGPTSTSCASAATAGHWSRTRSLRAWTLINQLPGKLDLGDDPEKVGEALARLDQVDGWAEFDVEFREVDAGRFVSEAVAMMCSVAGPWALTDRHPEVRRIVLDGEALPLPEPLRLSTSLYAGRAIRVIGPTLVLEMNTGGWEWVCELAYPPFAHRLRLAAEDAPPQPGLDTGDLTTYPPGQRNTLTARAQLGFGHTPFPGDFRSRAQVEAGGYA